MNLITISTTPIGEEPVPTVDARELHGFLEVGKDFSNWIKAQFERGRLQAGRDYVEVSAQKGENPAGGRPRTDYALTIDAAKHIAMMSGTEKGFEVRDYFIECERQARQPQIDPSKLSRADLARMVLEESAEKQALQQVVAAQTPKVEAFERIAVADGTFCIRAAAKLLQVRPTDLRNLLITERWIYGRPGHSGWLAYQDRIQQGLLIHKTTSGVRPDGHEWVSDQVRVTTKGLTKLGELLTRRSAA
jgi:phage anti-repressor protein/phage antirepressor YoqD-like protein